MEASRDKKRRHDGKGGRRIEGMDEKVDRGKEGIRQE